MSNVPADHVFSPFTFRIIFAMIAVLCLSRLSALIPNQFSFS